MTNNQVLRVAVDIPIESAFRKSDSFNSLQTYPVPPVTTVRGMIYASMGRPSLLNQHSKPYTPSKSVIDEEREFRTMFEQKTQIGIKVCDSGVTKTDLRNRMKVGRSDDEAQYKTYVAQEETILNPKYKLYIGCADVGLFKDIKNSLENPERLLYLGRSDDIVCISDISTHTYTSEELPNEERILAPKSNGKEPFLLPVKSDFKATYTTKPSKSRIVSFSGNIKAKKIELDGKSEYFEFID